jgi:hypothetical protein
MSTRCTIHFGTEAYGDEAIIYRHSDGYPESEHGVPATLQRFFEAVEAQCPNDTRYNDGSYLAAKFLVYQANKYSRRSSNAYVTSTHLGGAVYDESKVRMLDFLSVAPVLEDPGDIEYRYTVHCDQRDDSEAGRPVVTWEEL